ncbi:MAG: DUF488 domain-containing protein [Methylomonas sp.]|jgi:hypothetical protein
MSGATPTPIVLTIGHSTHSIEDFIGLLRTHGAIIVLDVRTVPGSRHNPQFNKLALSDSLQKAGLKYIHLPGLGGLRHAKSDSLNLGWRNASFRAYADYMQTPEFNLNLDGLIRLATQQRSVLMCAEALPWRCHRSLIADALLLHGICTEHIISTTHRQLHTLTPFAKVQGMTITYPGVCKRTFLTPGDRLSEQSVINTDTGIALSTYSDLFGFLKRTEQKNHYFFKDISVTELPDTSRPLYVCQIH